MSIRIYSNIPTYNKVQAKSGKNNVRFAARIPDNDYDRAYSGKDGNGCYPDEFITETRLKKLDKRIEDTVVYDLGAGQGRNSVSIALKGYKTYACEINDYGFYDIFKLRNKLARNGKIKSSNLVVVPQNILDKFQMPEKADFAFMSHITQHLNLDELQTALSHISESMVAGGELVFDVLLRTDKDYKFYDNLYHQRQDTKHENIERYGAASFWESDIIKAAETAGFKFVQKEPFNEKRAIRYTKQGPWGGRWWNFAYLAGFPANCIHKPVKLTWLVFKKL